MKESFGKFAYGSLFTILLPALLAAWAWRLDHSSMVFWAIPVPPSFGVLLAVLGLVAVGVAMTALWRLGKGWPMNAYPPTRLVTGSLYAIVPHPIYAGFVGMVGGLAIAFDSPAGLWVVTPIMALACIALVAGFEGPRLRERFGDADWPRPLLGLPPDTAGQAPLARRLAAGTIALAPWAALYALLSTLPAPPGGHELRWAWEFTIPTVDWMFWVYSAAYPAVMIAPLLLRTNAQLRRFVVGAWLATLLGFLAMLTFPGHASFLPTTGETRLGWLIDANRTLDADWLAAPSFHVLWMVFAAACFAIRHPKQTPLGWFLAAAVGASCVLTGSHALIDVICGAVLGLLCWHHEPVWRWLVGRAEVLGNSWHAIQIGPLRIIGHAVWSASAATVGILVIEGLLGAGYRNEVAFVFAAGLFAAGAWGYWLEGGNRLARPFGYYGFLFGSVAALLILAVRDPDRAGWLTAAFAVAAPLAQAIGRMRCLVQGCCHGKPVLNAVGLRVTHPCSRVTALSQLTGVPIHPTQVYSVAANLLIFAVLLRLWNVGAECNFIGGLYLVLSSLGRFIEEHYRGETQTPSKHGLAIYQWLAILLFVAGIVLSMAPARGVTATPIDVGLGEYLIAIAAGLIAAFFMSVDFPRSSRRFSRLTVNSAPYPVAPVDR